MKISSMKILMVHADKEERGRLAIMLARFEHSIAFTNKVDVFDLKLDSYDLIIVCLLYTSPSPRDRQKSRMPSSA